MGKAARVATILLLALLFAGNVYRAATQSIAHDEAVTWELYLAGPFSLIFDYYDPNNHFLASILMRLSTTLFGLSELAVRLPTIAACALYFFVVYRLSLLLFGETLWTVLSALVLTTNPLLLDFLVAARGYGLAVALFIFAFWRLLVYTTAEKPRRALLYQGAVALSGAVMANMALLLAAFVISVLFFATLPEPASVPEPKKRSGKQKAPGRPNRGSEMVHFVWPVAACALIYFLAYPLQQATSESFYSIKATLADSVQDLVRAGLAHNQGLANLNRAGAPRDWWLRALAFGFLPATVLAAVAAAVRPRERSTTWLILLWSGGTTAGSLLLHALTHFLFGWPYPADRTGVYLTPLFLLTLMSLIAFVRGRADAWRFGLWPLAALASLLAAAQMIQYNWTHFYVWPYNSDDKRIVERLDALRNGSDQPLNIGISWQLEPCFNYYRVARKLKWLPPFDRRGPRGDYDYYVLIPGNRDLVKEKGLEILYEGPHSGTVLAKASQRGAP